MSSRRRLPSAPILMTRTVVAKHAAGAGSPRQSRRYVKGFADRSLSIAERGLNDTYARQGLLKTRFPRLSLWTWVRTQLI